MNIEGELPAKRTYCFVSMQTSGRKPLFEQHETFRQVVESAWAIAFSKHTDVAPGEYNLNSVGLYALVPVDREAGEAIPYLSGVLSSIREATQTAWKEYVSQQGIRQGPLLWKETFELRIIENKREISSLRDFIVQKMLGGKELSDLGLEDLDE